MKSLLFGLASLVAISSAFAANPTNPILFVTQVPMPDEVNSRTASLCRASSVSPIQNPSGDTASCGRGGALWIRYSDGSLRNLTHEAGYGVTDASGNAFGVAGGNLFQGANSIAVQRPCMHWSGTKAIFSMVVGGPTSASDTSSFYWQLYEVTNLGKNHVGPAQITKVANQPATFNNLQACYASDDQIIFSSDRPRNLLLYPQRDEYLLLPTNTGLWKLDPANPASLTQLVNAPSGAFTPFIDGGGKLLFIQWDHLSRDPEAVTDRAPISANGDNWVQTFNGMGNFASEAANATFTVGTNDQFPEPRNFDKTGLLQAGHFNGQSFNQFTPWQLNQDGTNHEVLNHVGRHELYGSIATSFTAAYDSSLVALDVTTNPAARPYLNNLFQMVESPIAPGTMIGIDAQDVGSHGAGQIVAINAATVDPVTHLRSDVNPESMAVTLLTTYSATVSNPRGVKPILAPSAGTSYDVYRNAVPFSDGSFVATHANVNIADSDTGTKNGVNDTIGSHYAFRLRALKTQASGSPWIPDAAIVLTAGFTANVRFFLNGVSTTYSGALWELDPVEVVARSVPPAALAGGLAAPEQTVFDQIGVDVPTFQNYLRSINAALVDSRNVTQRDDTDTQQPLNLLVANTTTQTLKGPGTVYTIGWLQILQGDFLRGLTNNGSVPSAPPIAGRRVLATPLHDTSSEMPSVAGAPAGSVALAGDGSFAMIVPAAKALTWHLTDAAGANSIVKERYWVTFASGEIRTCANCHGLNNLDQAGHTKPTNPPQALAALLQFWKTNHPPGALQHASPTSAAQKTAATASLAVTRTGGSVGPVSVQYATVNGTALAGQDYAASSGTLSWADGDTAPKTISVPLLHNPAVGPSKTFTVALSSPVNGALGAATSAAFTVTEPPFGAWQNQHFGANANNALLAGPSVDGDGDGLSNLGEYAFNRDPAVTDSKTPFVASLEVDPGDGKTYLTLTYRRRLAPRDVTYHVEVSSDFMMWKENAPQVIESSATDDLNGVTETVKARAGTATDGGPMLFMRVRVTQP